MREGGRKRWGGGGTCETPGFTVQSDIWRGFSASGPNPTIPGSADHPGGGRLQRTSASTNEITRGCEWLASWVGGFPSVTSVMHKHILYFLSSGGLAGE